MLGGFQQFPTQCSVLPTSSSTSISNSHSYLRYSDMAPVEPSFIMFSVKLQGSEAVSVRVVACSVTFFFRNALLWCSWGLSRVVMLIMGHHHQDINNFLAESARHGWTRKQKWSLCQGERGVIKQSFQYNTTPTSRKKHEILPSHWGHIKRKLRSY